MDFDTFFENIISPVQKYRIHIIVFLITLFIGLTIAHPATILNDEWITTNQLYQLHAGHQIVINEGKYGLWENGTMSAYFAYRSNVLGYSLFQPIISLPAFSIIDITGDHFVFFVLYIWTFTSLAIILLIHFIFREFSYIGRWRWTPFMIVSIFVVFFVNLFYYSVFQVNGFNTFPEVIAIVFTNVFLLAMTAVMIYEINRTLFEDPAFSFFSTFVCLCSSSYFLWVTVCKDHMLVFILFTAILLCLVRFFITDENWYLPLAFLISGLLAWARPELALWVFLFICGVCGYTVIRFRSQKRSCNDFVFILFSPLFTLVGALPFFLNNNLVTKNFLLPAMTLYLSEKSLPYTWNMSHTPIRVAGVESIQSAIMMFVPAIPSSPLDFLSDLFGIFFLPQNGAISIIALTPLFFVMAILALVLLFYRKLQFTPEEKRILMLNFFISMVVFLAYVRQIHTLNTDSGIIPDIRYLSPIYLPLTILGLSILRKVNIISNGPESSIKKICAICIIGTPVSLIIMSMAYSAHLGSTGSIMLIDRFFSYSVVLLALIILGTLFWTLYTNRAKTIQNYLIPFLCSLPFFWQIDMVFFIRTFSGGSSYTFWIPLIRIFYDLTVKYILVK